MDMSTFGDKKIVKQEQFIKFAYVPTFVGYSTIWLQSYIEEHITYQKEVGIMAVCAGGRHFKTIHVTEVTKHPLK